MLFFASSQNPSRPAKGQEPFPILQRDRVRALSTSGSCCLPSLSLGVLVLVEGAALQRGHYLGLGVLSTWGARTGARLHRLVCRRCTGCLSWEVGHLLLSSCSLAGGIPCTGA